MPRRRSSSEIALEDERQLKRQQDFRAAADAVVAGLTAFAEVEKIALFGSATRPLAREVPAFSPIGGSASNCCTNARMGILRYGSPPPARCAILGGGDKSAIDWAGLPLCKRVGTARP